MKVMGIKRTKLTLPQPSNVLPMVRPFCVYEYDDDHARQLIQCGVVRRYSGTKAAINMTWLAKFIEQE